MVAEKPPTSEIASVAPSKSSRRFFDGVTGAVGASGLLVGEERENQVPLGFVSRPGKVPHDGEDHGVHVLHVHSSAAPNEAVLELCAEGVPLPLLPECGNYVEVPVSNHALAEGSSPAIRVTTLARPGRRFENLCLEAHFGQ